ncbi:MAG: methyl-accepting chemotaxis protein [Cocleimonas sp.]|jgi:methyl-accepting chemotaxis protein
MKSIKFKFISIVSTMILAIMMVFSFININIEKSQFKKDQRISVNLSINGLSGSVTKGLWDFEDQLIATSVNDAFENHYLDQIIILNAENELVYGVKREKDKTKKIIVEIPNKQEMISRPLMVEDELAGTLMASINTKIIEERINRKILLSIIQSVGIVILLIIVITFLLKITIFKPMSEITNAFKAIAEGNGDLTKRVNYTENNEIGQLVSYFNQFIKKIHGSVYDVDRTTQTLTNVATKLDQANQKSMVRVNATQNETMMVATSIKELSQAIQDISLNANEAENETRNIHSEASKTREVVNHAVESIGALSANIQSGSETINSLKVYVEDIVSVLEVITGIADQTNLLALNAAIEAARAGEQGRGFAVVADEVRALANRTQKSTTEVKEILSRLQTGSEKAVQVMNDGMQESHEAVKTVEKAFSSLDLISEGIDIISKYSIEISAAVKDSVIVTTEVNNNTEHITELTKNMMSDSKRAESAGKEMVSEVDQLKKMLMNFKL